MSEVIKVGKQSMGSSASALIELLSNPATTSEELIAYSQTPEGELAWASLTNLPKSILDDGVVLGKMDNATIRDILELNTELCNSLASSHTAYMMFCNHPLVLECARRRNLWENELLTNTAHLDKIFPSLELRRIFYANSDDSLLRRLVHEDSAVRSHLVNTYSRYETFREGTGTYKPALVFGLRSTSSSSYRIFLPKMYHEGGVEQIEVGPTDAKEHPVNLPVDIFVVGMTAGGWNCYARYIPME